MDVREEGTRKSKGKPRRGGLDVREEALGSQREAKVWWIGRWSGEGGRKSKRAKARRIGR